MSETPQPYIVHVNLATFKVMLIEAGLPPTAKEIVSKDGRIIVRPEGAL